MNATARPNRPLHVPAHERAIRAEAGDPRNSVFLSANAGSGKTTILTGRVMRLLLDGVDPSGILCLTYTKAAAAEMQDRIFKELAEWVTLPAEKLAEKVAALTGAAPNPDQLLAARRLFARAIETPGGLKLQTIHAFAERLLHLFPFEANVPFRFQVIDALAQAELMAGARRQAVIAALGSPSTALGCALDQIAATASESTLSVLLDGAMPLFSRRKVTALGAGERDRALRRALGLGANETPRSIAEEVLGGPLPPEAWPQVIEALMQGSENDQNLGKGLRQAADLDPEPQARAFVRLLLKADGTVPQRIVTKTVVARSPRIAEALKQESQRVAPLRNRFLAIDTLDRSLNFWTLAEAVQERFVAAKQQQGLADFDDLIERTLQLVADPGAAWVLCKLDAGIRHVLVDEAQDTSPAMWRIVGELTAEFFAGEGASRQPRTVFAVGDEKQSIYSFQGADPQAFAVENRRYRTRAAEAGAPFLDRNLKLSFRTVIDILAAVDAVFAVPGNRRGLSAEDIATTHETARVGDHGFVEIWPLVQQERNEPRDPSEEVDAPGRYSASVNAAGRIARHVRALIDEGRFEDDGTPVRPGDIMVLVQRRDAVFDSVIRALKRLHVPVAGADRIKLTEQIAVLDLLAAARAALLPDDDLSIAEVLKGPFIGLDDADLLRLAPRRTGSLFAALAISEDAAHRAAHARIEGWRVSARDRGPYGFFQEILGPEGGRRRLLSRLGLDAAEAIEVFLSQVQSFEQREPPTLQGFLTGFADFEGDVKRDQEQAGDAVRVLTAHGAKGLEARIVYLADAARLPVSNKDARVIAMDGALVWTPPKADCPDAILRAREAERAARMDEYRRLLYVAMTRARDRLYVSGWNSKNGLPAESWYAMIDAALSQHRRDVINEIGETVARWQIAVPPPSAVVSPPRPPDALTALPHWSARPVPREEAGQVIRPARVLDRPEELPAARSGPRLRGGLVHLLLEVLPGLSVELRRSAGVQLLEARAPGLPAGVRQRMVDEALALMQAPGAAAVFGPGSRAEVPISGRLRLGPRQELPVSGRIDRLLITPDRIVVADFKSGHPPADGTAHAAQLALYRALLRQLYPDRPVECLILWTRDARVERLPEAVLDSALAEAITASAT